MSFSSKMVGRLTGANSEKTHTNSLREQINGRFSRRSLGWKRSSASFNDRTVAEYRNSMIARSGNKRERALNSEEQEKANQMRKDNPRTGYAQASEKVRSDKKSFNTPNSRDGFGNRLANSGSRFDSNQFSRGAGGAGASGATPARTITTPNFRPPMK